ncbi:hypothetical protein ACWF2L_33280 [Streptomyces anulatus]
MSEHAGTSDVLLAPLTGPARRKGERLARQEAEDRVFVVTDDDSTVLAVDEASEADSVIRRPQAVMVRSYARSPVSLTDGGSARSLERPSPSPRAARPHPTAHSRPSDRSTRC